MEARDNLVTFEGREWLLMFGIVLAQTWSMADKAYVIPVKTQSTIKKDSTGLPTSWVSLMFFVVVIQYEYPLYDLCDARDIV